jgi:hypothetical protein
MAWITVNLIVHFIIVNGLMINVALLKQIVQNMEFCTVNMLNITV